MFEILILSFLVTFLFTPYGYLFNKGHNIRSFSIQFVFALILLSFVSLFINFFSPISKIISTSFIIFGFFFLVKLREVYFGKKYFIYCAISTIIIFLLITASNVYRPDAGLYHLPYIGIINNEKIIFGLSNIHFRYGHISILQYTSAIFNNIIFRDNGIIFPSAAIASGIIINFLSNLNKKIKKEKYDFHFFVLLSFTIFIFYKINRFSEYGNDAPAHLLMFLLISEIIKNFQNINYNKFSNYLLLSFFILMNKIILLLSIFFPLVLFFNKNLKIKFFNIKNLFIIFFVFCWFLKNIIISGCLLYPIKNSCLNILPWTNLGKANYVSIENEAWAKGWPDFRDGNSNITQEEYSKNFNWFQTWSKNHFIKIIEIIIPYLIFLSIILLAAKSNLKKSYLKKYEKYLIFLSIIGVLMWFLKVPVFRYGFSYLIILVSLSFAFFANFISFKKNLFMISRISLILLLSIFVLKNSNRIIFEDKKYFNYPWPKIYSMDENNIPKKHVLKIINGKKFYKSNDNYCMYNFSPCGINLDKLSHKKIFNYSLITQYLK